MKKGFTLLEALAALTIFAVAITAFIQSMGTATRLQADRVGRDRAAMLAQNVMEELRAAAELKTGREQGRFKAEDERFTWTTSIEETGVDRLMKVEVAIAWREGAIEELVLNPRQGRLGVVVVDGRVAVATGDEVILSTAHLGEVARAFSASEIATHDAKTQRLGLVADDTLIAAYLVDPGRAGYELDDLAREHGVELLPDPPAEEETAALVRHAEAARRLAPQLRARLREWGSEQLYDEVSAYLQRDVLVALPNARRKLITLILRKLLASSSAAIGATLAKFAQRLSDQAAEPSPPLETLTEDFESAAEIDEEWTGDEGTASPETPSAAVSPEARSELADLERFVQLARSVERDSKATKLVEVLPRAFELAQEKGASVVSEGVETEHHAARLRALGCDWGQGFWFAKPLSPEDATARLRGEWGKRVIG